MKLRERMRTYAEIVLEYVGSCFDRDNVVDNQLTVCCQIIPFLVQLFNPCLIVAFCEQTYFNENF